MLRKFYYWKKYVIIKIKYFFTFGLVIDANNNSVVTLPLNLRIQSVEINNLIIFTIMEAINVEKIFWHLILEQKVLSLMREKFRSWFTRIGAGIFSTFPLWWFPNSQHFYIQFFNSWKLLKVLWLDFTGLGLEMILHRNISLYDI